MMNRREILQTMGTAGAGMIVLGPNAWASALSSGTAPARRLVVVFLRGAVDGLSLVVPYREKNYYRLRPTIAIAKPGETGGAIDLDGNFGLHPALAALFPLWRHGSLAFVHAAGSPDPTRSHFDGQDNIESGTPGNKATPDGWLNRLEGALPADAILRAAPMRAVSIGAVSPRIFLGPNRVTTVASGATAMRPSVLDKPDIQQAFASIYRDDRKTGPTFNEYVVARKDVVAALNDADPETMAANNGAPSSYAFHVDAARLGTLMRRDPRVQLGFLAVSGWDTHAKQGGVVGQLSSLLTLFAQGMAALAQNLGPVYADTAIVVLSEFGRTIAQNGNGGTDHGYGNVMWLLGGNVAGGKVHGDWSGMDDGQLHEGRDLPVTTDYRTVLAQVCERHLSLPDGKLSDVFPAMPKRAPSLRLIRT
jgi:uncharacterized protein (DUF1501 family)